MKGFLLLLCCAEILSAQLCGAETTADESSNDADSKPQTNFSLSTTVGSNTVARTTGTVPSSVHNTSQQSSAPTSPTTTTTTATSTVNTPFRVLYRKECFLVTMVAGGLILVCAILLLCTLMLTCKVCQMSRSLKTLSSNSPNRTVTAQKDKSKSEPEANESTMLMSEIGQTQEDVGNGTTKEAGGNGNEDELTAGEIKKEAGGAASSEEASTGESKKETSAAVAENPSASQPQEDASAGVASFPEGTEEPKDVV